MVEHATEGCSCEGKLCSKCGKIKCLGRMPKRKNKKGEIKYTSQCHDCCNERKRAWAAANPDKVKAANRKWQESNPDKAYVKTHPEEAKAYKHEWYLKNAERQKAKTQERIEQINKRRRERFRNDPNKYEKGRAYRARYAPRIAAWRRMHTEVNKRNCARRLALLRSAKGTYTSHEWESLKRHYNYTCLCCGKSEPEIKLTVDHIVPLSKRGTNTIDNIQPLCFSCNSRKYMEIIDYRF